MRGATATSRSPSTLESCPVWSRHCSPKPTPKGRAEVRTILLVEDNPTTRKLVRFALQKKGFAVLEAPDGRSALALMAQKPDLVLQDIILPDMDGFALVS